MARCSAFLQYSYEDDVFVNMTFANGNATTLTDDVPNRTIQGLQITPMRQVKLSCHSQFKHAIEEFTLLTKTKASFSKMHCNVENAGKRNVPKANATTDSQLQFLLRAFSISDRKTQHTIKHIKLYYLQEKVFSIV